MTKLEHTHAKGAPIVVARHRSLHLSANLVFCDKRFGVRGPGGRYTEAGLWLFSTFHAPAETARAGVPQQEPSQTRMNAST